MKILSLSYSDTAGGAAKAAYRIQSAANALGTDVQSEMLVKHRHTNDTRVHSIDAFLPQNRFFKAFDWARTKILNKLQHLAWYPYRNRKEKLYMSDLRGVDIGDSLLKMDYDVLHLHFINNRFVDIEELIKADKAYRKKHDGKALPIVWTLHDSWPFCGVCHYFLDCEGYKHECGDCPQLWGDKRESINQKRKAGDLSHQVWAKKKKVFDQLDLHIVSPSHWLADCARESSLFQGRDIRVIPNCIDTEVFLPIDIATMPAALKQNAAVSRILRAAGEKAEKPFVLYGAANAASDRIKGFSSLLSALELLDKQGFEANLVVFGASKSDLKMDFQHVAVTFVGFIGDTDSLVWLYNAADVMVVPSLTENLSCAIMEALSCGTPVCCFNIGGNGDMVEHGVNGYLAREKDCTDLAEGIRVCVHHSAEWGTFARESVVRKYSVDVVAKQYAELYREVTC